MKLAFTSDLDSIGEQWRSFQEKADHTPFQSHGWLKAWQETIGVANGIVPLVVTGSDEKDLLFILPLAIERATGIRRLVFLGRQSCDYNAPLLAPGFNRHVPEGGYAHWWTDIRSAIAAEPAFKHEVVMFDKLPALVGRQPNPLVHLDTVPHPSSAHSTKLGSSWEDYYSGKRSSNTRRRDRTKQRKLSNFGRIAFVEPQAPADRLATLDILIAQKSRAFRRMGVADFLSSPGCRGFLRRIALDPGTGVHLSRLDVGPNAVAVNLWVKFRECYYHVLASYDDGPSARFGAGMLHLHELMRRAIEQGCQHFDFTVGDEPYKELWAEETIPLYDHISGAGMRGRAAAHTIRLAFQLKRFVKQSPRLWTFAQRIRSLRGSAD